MIDIHTESFDLHVFPSCVGLKSAWTSVFLLRLWWVWLLLVRSSSLSSSRTKSKTKCREKYFVTRPAFFPWS